MLGFLRWTFKDAYKNVQFWAFSICILAIVAQLAGCPDPIPWYTTLTGVAISLLDLAYYLIGYQYNLYKLEQNRIARELSRK